MYTGIYTVELDGEQVDSIVEQEMKALSKFVDSVSKMGEEEETFGSKAEFESFATAVGVMLDYYSSGDGEE